MSNNNQLGSKISQLLSNPDSLKEIIALASSLGISEKNDNNEEKQINNTVSNETDTMQDRIPLPLRTAENLKGDERVDLLMSIKPFLGSRKQQKVDGLVKALTAAKIINTYKDSDLFSLLGLK